MSDKNSAAAVKMRSTKFDEFFLYFSLYYLDQLKPISDLVQLLFFLLPVFSSSLGLQQQQLHLWSHDFQLIFYLGFFVLCITGSEHFHYTEERTVLQPLWLGDTHTCIE